MVAGIDREEYVFHCSIFTTNFRFYQSARLFHFLWGRGFDFCLFPCYHQFTNDGEKEIYLLLTIVLGRVKILIL